MTMKINKIYLSTSNLLKIKLHGWKRRNNKTKSERKRRSKDKKEDWRKKKSTKKGKKKGNWNSNNVKLATKPTRKKKKNNVKDTSTEILITNSLTYAKVWLIIARVLNPANSKNSKIQENSKLVSSISEKNGRKKSKEELKSSNLKKASLTNKVPRNR